MKLRQIVQALDTLCPFSEAEPWDNVGLLCGDAEREVTCAAVCLDVTPEVIAEAVRAGAQLVISHHPVIFRPLSALTADSMAYALVRADLAAVAVHTNLDKAVGGVGDTLVQALGLRPGRSEDPLLRIGYTARELTPEEWAREVSRRLQTPVRVRRGSRPIHTVAVACGAGGEYTVRLREYGADALVTGEVKHHEWLAAGDCTVVDAGHAATERVIVEPLCRHLAEKLPGLQLIACETPLPYETL